MSSTSFPASEDSALALSEPGCEPSRSARLIRSAGRSSQSIGPASPPMTTCEALPLTDSPQMALPLMSSVEASPARISAWPETAQALPESEADYGESTLGLLGKYDPVSSSWRTYQLCLVEGLETFSGTWPRSGIMLNGIAYQLQPLAPLTDEIDSGLWATPTVCGNYNRKGASKTSGDGLATQVRMWPTPVARDYRSPGRSRLERTGSKAGDCLPQVVGGQLNPKWVEWLMGFPAEWTALDSSEIRSSRKSRKSSAGRS
jgi:hypothetical protein